MAADVPQLGSALLVQVSDDCQAQVCVAYPHDFQSRCRFVPIPQIAIHVKNTDVFRRIGSRSDRHAAPSEISPISTRTTDRSATVRPHAVPLIETIAPAEAIRRPAGTGAQTARCRECANAHRHILNRSKEIAGAGGLFSKPGDRMLAIQRIRTRCQTLER